MVCSTKKAASKLAHTRWGTTPKKSKKSKGTRIKENEPEAPGVKARRKAGKPSTHFESVVAALEKKHGSEKKKKKPAKKAASGPVNTLIPRKKPKPGPVINTLIPRRKKK
jgi:hypothetical protein